MNLRGTRKVPTSLETKHSQNRPKPQIVGIILIAAGIGSLAYFASPMRLMLQETVTLHPLKPNMVLPGLTCTNQPTLVLAAQKVLVHRARCNQAARRGEYSAAMETR
jgi:hypothetical protein